jgi:hypothetical protein
LDADAAIAKRYDGLPLCTAQNVRVFFRGITWC